MSMTYLTGLRILPTALLLLTWLAGIFLAARGWDQHPRKSGLAVGGLAVFLVTTVLGWAASFFLSDVVRLLGGEKNNTGTVVMLLTVFQTIPQVLGWGLIVAALFVKEHPREG